MAVAARTHDRASENQSDEDLVRRANAGDEVAQEDLYHKYRTQFLVWIRRWLRHKEWAVDFADAAIAQLFEVLHQYKPELSNFRTWAFIVAKTSVIKYIRDLHTERDDVSADDLLFEVLPALTSPEEDFVVGRVREEVAHLDREQRAAVGGRFYAGLTDDDLAVQLGIPRRRVCYRRRQALAALRKRLTDVPFTSIRPGTCLSGYNYMMDDVKTNELALPGGKEGD